MTRNGRPGRSRTPVWPAPPPPRARCRLIVFLAIALLASGCFGSGKKQPTGRATPASAATLAVTAAAGVATLTPGAGQATTPAPGAVDATPRGPVTPPAGTPTPAATPAPSATAAVREENGLRIQDERFTGKIAVAGGLRIRSSPDASGSNVVGSVPEGATVQVEGKVLNGAEAESGKGTTWYIVGIKQYIYGAEGYVQNLGTPAPPAPAATPRR